MKKTILFSTLLMTLCLLIPHVSAAELTETRALDSFDKIIATNGVNVMLRKGSENKAEIHINNALLSDLRTEIKDNTLKIKLRPQINKDLSVLVIITYKQIKELSATKGASIQTKTVMLTDKLSFSTNTGGDIKAEVECKEIKISAGGGSKITLYGWTQRLEAKGNTKAHIDTKKLQSEKIIAKATGGAEIWGSPKDYLEAICTTGGTIYYISKPESINKRISSGGALIDKTKENAIGYDLIKDEE